MRTTAERGVAALEAHEARVAGHTVRYWAAGSGEPVVFVHGLSGSARWWRWNVPAVAEHYRVYLVDLPGFGATRRLSARVALAEMSAWLHEWLEAAGVGPAHVVGHSMGGYVGLRLAAVYPQSVQRLVLVAPVGMPAGRSVLGHVAPLTVTGATLALRFLPVVVWDALRAGPWTLWRAGRELLAEDVRPLLAAISAPTLLVWGSRDRLVPVQHGPVLREAIAGAQLLVLDGARHVPMVERPREFNAALLAFLAGQPVPSAAGAAPASPAGPGALPASAAPDSHATAPPPPADAT